MFGGNWGPAGFWGPGGVQFRISIRISNLEQTTLFRTCRTCRTFERDFRENGAVQYQLIFHVTNS